MMSELEFLDIVKEQITDVYSAITHSDDFSIHLIFTMGMRLGQLYKDVEFRMDQLEGRK